MTTERKLLALLVIILIALPLWNAYRIAGLMTVMQARTLLRWRADDMQNWIGEVQRRADIWADENHTSRLILPSTEFR